MSNSGKTFVVEHLDPELEAWSSLEYATIAAESHSSGAKFLLSSVPTTLKLPENLQHVQGLAVETRGIEEIYADKKDKVCLLDPAASKDLSPEDGDTFDIFLFGGILGDDPPRDRTSELRKKGYQGRRLGPVQMTTDTAVRVTRIIVQDRTPVDKIPFVDHPEIKINKNESTQMPFRYVKGNDGQPIMPEGMVELISKDSEKNLIDELF
ncbi:SAM-dependent RNA methyltransferase [Paraphoma chrysanthemicola]|uniref:SAM-dependent RNA methyltransferase n=1 Tax=Paraphoma chrysanthemicola TaxID=798071 RepID=A0A8K0REH0_9PLEO|nr:SAM-dependent RNA methyltransferase [Paraphoma chrysanthemicola]